MPGAILDDGVADLFEFLQPTKDFHPNISQHDFPPPSLTFQYPLLIVQYSIRHGLYVGPNLLAVNPGADI